MSALRAAGSGRRVSIGTKVPCCGIRHTASRKDEPHRAPGNARGTLSSVAIAAPGYGARWVPSWVSTVVDTTPVPPRM